MFLNLYTSEMLQTVSERSFILMIQLTGHISFLMNEDSIITESQQKVEIVSEYVGRDPVIRET